jgi:hypothetical protein
MKKVMKRRAKHTRKKLTLDTVLEKLNSIIQKLDIIESDLREIKKVVFPKSDLEEKEPTPEFFIQK